jgi:acetyl esterase
MAVDPRLQPILDAAGTQPLPTTRADAAQTRAALHAMAEQMLPVLTHPGPEMAAVVDETVPVQGGEIQVRIYRPSTVQPLPVCVYIHGGGWWQGNLALVDPECRRLAADGGCVVVSVAYRLAPEHPFPTPPEDCYAALVWVVDHADRLGIDPQRVALAGGSAGANLAAAVTLLARDRGGPKLVAQVLVVPATDLTLNHPSFEEFGEGCRF